MAKLVRKHHFIKATGWLVALSLVPIALATTTSARFSHPNLKSTTDQWDQRTIINWNDQKQININAKPQQNNVQIKQRLHWKLPIKNVNPLYLNELKLALTNQATIQNQVGYYDNIASESHQLGPSTNHQSVQFTNQWTNQTNVSQNLSISAISANVPIQFRSHFEQQQILSTINISNDPQNGASIIVNGQNLPQGANDYLVEATLSDLNLPAITPPIGPPYLPEQPPLKWNYQLLGTQSVFHVNRQILQGAKVSIINNGHPDLWISTNPDPNPSGFNHQNSGDPRVGFLNTALSGNANWTISANDHLEWNQDLDLNHQLQWEPLIKDRYQYRYQADYDHQIAINFDLPNLKQRMQFLVDQISHNAKWDNEFFFGPTAFNKAIKEFKEFSLPDNINLLFLSDDQKAKVLTWFYQDVVKQVFALDAKPQANRRFNLLNDQSAAGLKIYQPKDYRVWVDTEFTNTVLKLQWIDWDGSTQVVQSPIKTKFYLEPEELMINNQVDVIDFSKIPNSALKFGDQFGQLDDDQINSKLIYQNWFNYQDQTNPFAIFQSAMTYDVFSKSLFATNLINWQNPQRSIYFSSRDDKQKPLNQWSQLALGQGRFRLIIGQEIKQFFLPNVRQNLVLTKTFQITNFFHQYDIYYASGATNLNTIPNLIINAQAIDVNNVDPQWILNNLILYDNQSLDPAMKLTNGTYHDQLLLATNLDQAAFKKILKPQVQILDRNLSTGTLKVQLSLANFAHQPDANKKQQIKATNQIIYQLYDWNAAGLPNSQASQNFYFEINGFNKNYDLAINNNRNLDAYLLNLDHLQADQIDLKQLVDQVIAFDHYQNHDDPLWNYKLLLTRLSQPQFHQLMSAKINLITQDHWQGIGRFEIDFSGSQSQINNALNHNYLVPTSSNFQILMTLKNRFQIVNLAPEMEINFHQTNYQLKQDLDLIDNEQALWTWLLEQNLIGFKQQNLQDYLFNTNAIDQASFINSIKNNQVQINNLKIVNPSTIQFMIKFNARKGQVKINGKSQNQITFTISGFKNQPVANLTLNANKIKMQTIWDLPKIDWQLIIEDLIAKQSLIINEQNNWPSWKLWQLIDKQSLKIIPSNQFATDFQAIWNLNSVANINGHQSQNLTIKVEKLDPVANIKAKANQVDLQKQVSMQAIDQIWIWNNLWSFSDQVNPQAIFDNHLLTKAQFLQQVQTTINIYQSDQQTLMVTINLKRINPSLIDFQPFVQTTIKMTNFANPLNYWNDWQKQTITWITTGAIISLPIIIIPLWNRVRRAKQKH